MVTPSRTLEAILEVFLRAAPHKARAAGERAQADEIYKHGTPLSVSSNSVLGFG
jgi:E3 ubiquitin-protein ligase CHFR